MSKRNLLLIVVLFWSMISALGVPEAKVKTWVIGGGIPWAQYSSLMISMDDTTNPGALQPREFDPNVNIIQTLGKKHYFRVPRNDPLFIKGEGMRCWLGTNGADGESKWLIDADPTTKHGTLTGGSPARYWVTLDTGFPVYADRFVFYPPQEGVDPFGRPFKEDYMRGYELSASVAEPDFIPMEGTGAADPYHLLPNLLKRVFSNFDSIVEVDFPLQKLRFLRLRSTANIGFLIAEMELYGKGFAPKALFRSKVIDLGRPVNFGKVKWWATKLRQERIWQPIDGRWNLVGGDPQPVPVSDAPVSITVKTMSGSDETPFIYHKINDMLEEVEVTESEYKRLYAPPSHPDRPVLPGQRGSVTRDIENWSLWSEPMNGKITSPGPRRFFRFEIILESDSPWTFVRIDSLSFEYSSVLAKEVIGEVAVLDDPVPSEGIAVVVAGEPVTFTYDIRTEFDAAHQGGYDAIRIVVPRHTVFEELKMGTPLGSVSPKNVSLSAGNLDIYLPHKITQAKNEPIRLIFTTQVTNYITRFIGEVFDTQSGDLPQSITPGNATDNVSTNKLTVLASEASLQGILSTLDISPRCITPNNDSHSETVEISYTILQAETAHVDITIYDISGMQVRKLVSEEEPAGQHNKQWDGKDDVGALVPPGIYICNLLVETNKGVTRKTKTLTVVY